MPQDIIDFAFNRGIFDHETIEAAVAKGIAVRQDIGADTIVVSHFRIEVFEDDVTSRHQRAMFAAVESRFLAALDGSRVLQAANLRAVTLNSIGELLANPTVLIIEAKRNGTSFDVDRSETKSGATPLRVWRDSLTPAVTQNLHWLSGFLQMNPGRLPIELAPTDTAVVLAILDLVVGLVPSKLEKIFGDDMGKFMEDVLKKLGLKSLTEFMGELTLHWGASEEITSAQATRHKETYIKDGKRIWTF